MTLPNLQKPVSRAAERKQEKADEAKRVRAIHAAVDKRDKGRCRACGARVSATATDLLKRAHRHHITFRSAGGEDTTANVLQLCAQCHSDIHAYRMTASGNADHSVAFSREGGFTWYSGVVEVL